MNVLGEGGVGEVVGYRILAAGTVAVTCWWWKKP